jgi:sulfite exporter TauE/SafE
LLDLAKLGESSFYLTLSWSAALLGAAFLGSWHCMSMCSPMASLAQIRGGLRGYQFGRGISYILMGMLWGFLGKQVSSYLGFAQGASLFVMFSALALIGLQLMGQRYTLGSSRWSMKLIQMIYPWLPKNSWSLGFTTGFLPCAWLYTFYLAASSTKSASVGAFVMFLFWMGTVPALSLAPLFLQKLKHVLNQSQQKWVGMFLVAASVYAIFSHYMMRYLWEH